MLCSLFSSLHLPTICIELKSNSAAHPTLCWHSDRAHLCCLMAKQIHHHSSYSVYNFGYLKSGPCQEIHHILHTLTRLLLNVTSYKLVEVGSAEINGAKA